MLEIRTILVVMSIGSLLAAFTLSVSCSGRFQDGLAKWVAALVLQAFAWGMYALHGIAPLLITDTLADAVLAVSWMLKLASLLEFQHRPIRKPQRWSGAALCVVLLLSLAGAGEDRGLLLLRGFIFATLTLAIAWLAWRIPDMPTSKARLLMVGIYTTVAIGFIARSIAALWLPTLIPDPLAATGFQSLTFLLGYSFIIVSAFCVVLIHKERTDSKNYLLAITDPLTGVYNRRTFLELADKLLAHSERHNSPVALLMIDIDHFKLFNDSYGHAVGDEALKETVARIRLYLRKEDLLIRLGGEEFGVLLPGSDADGAAVFAERIRLGIASVPLQVGDQAINMTVSVGVAMANHNSVRVKETLLADADKALYEAKDAGRNCVVMNLSTCGVAAS